jgi:hypothetical protein
MIVNNIRNLHKYSRECPALKDSLNNEGEFHSRKEVIEWVKKEYEIEKKYFLEMKKNNFNILKVYKFLPEDMLKKGWY